MQDCPIMAKPTELRIKVIEAINAGKTIVTVSQDYGVSARTVRRWLKKYREGGLAGLTQSRSCRVPWNITSNEIAEKVYLLKEQNPKITLSQAKNELLNKGVQVSMECIRKIWQRYGLAGYDKKKQSAEIMPNIPFSKDVAIAINKAGKILEKNGKVGHSNGMKEAARILNRLPYCSRDEILNKIPYQYLGLRRRVEKIPYLFGEEPLPKYYQRVRSLRLALEKKKLFYSSLRVGVAEANTLFWLGRPQQTFSLIKLLEKRLPSQGDPVICFLLTLLKGMTLSRLLRLNEAIQCAKRCKRLIKILPVSDFCVGLGNLYSNIGLYLQAKNYYEKTIPAATDTTRDQALLALAGCYTLNGEYQKVFNILKKIAHKESPVYTFIPLVRAQTLLGQGMIIEAVQYAKNAIEIAKKGEILQYLHTSTMILSAVYYALGENNRAKLLLQNTTSLLKKARMVQDYYIRMLLNRAKISVPERYKDEPFIKLILLMRKANQTYRLKDYNYALKFATQKGLKGHFQRLCIFYAEIITKLIERGRPTGLPKAILSLPVFNKNLPAFHISFLGPMKIYRAETLLTVRLRPKDAAFLIHLLMNRNRRMLLDDIYHNFWPRSVKPSQNLSHLLMRIRKFLALPPHLLRIRDNFLLWQFYYTTDFGFFEETITQAKALERAGEWEFARREYLRAFNLFRGEPFRKMYDQWSEDMRHRILTQLETEAISFVKNCLEHKNKKDAKRILEKVVKIIPDSEESQKYLRLFNY